MKTLNLPHSRPLRLDTLPQMPPHVWLLFILWLGAMIALPIARFFFGDAGTLWSLILGVVTQAALVLALLQQTWGTGRMLLTALGVMLLSWVAEAIGTATGWPFGVYHYTELFQPQVAHVPLLIPLAWLMMLPCAWAIAAIVTEGRFNALFILVSALAMTAWDLFLDPQMVGWGFWIWEQPGLYFGIPLINFFGWLLTAAIITAIVRPSLNLPFTPLITIYGIVWVLQTLGQLFFWQMIGPALFGFVGMGLCLLWAFAVHRKRQPA